ncbi:helix-turn-helix domain-containing protein [Enterococcus italicus]
MTVFERIKSLAKKHSKTMKQVTLDLNYSENYFYTLKNGKQPSAEKLNEIADYFGVSVDYLLGREEKTSLAEKHGVFAFDGEPVTDEEIEFLKSVLAAKRASEKK